MNSKWWGELVFWQSNPSNWLGSSGKRKWKVTGIIFWAHLSFHMNGQSYRVLVIMIFFHYFETEEWCLLSLRLTIIYEETQITFICLRRCVRRAHINSLLCYFCTTLRSIHEGSVSDACSYRPEYTAFLYLIIGKISLRYESYDTQGGTCTTADLKCFTGDGNIQIYHRSF